MSDPEAIPRDEFFDSLLGDFLDESGQLLDRLNENLLQLDEWVRSLDEDHQQRCDDELLNEMFRAAHSLKGLSAMLGLKDINQLTHKVENVFDAARRNELVVTGDVVELMFQAVDRLVSQVDALKEPDAAPVECDSVIQGIRDVLQQAGVERQQTSQADAEGALQQAAAPAEPPLTQSPPGQPAPNQPEPAQTQTEPVPAACKTPPHAGASAQPQIDCFQNLEDEAEIPAKYLAIFIDETGLSLDSLTETLLALEGGGSREAMGSLLVISHRIKGSAASIGLNRAAKLAHLMEDLLQNLVENGLALSPEVTDAMLKCTDALRQYVDALGSGIAPSDHFGQLARELLAAQAASLPMVCRPWSPQPAASTQGPPPAAPQPSPKVATPGPSVRPSGIDEQLRAKVAALAAEDDNAMVGKVVFQPNLLLAGLKARLVYEKLNNLGELCYFDPPPDTLDELENLESVCFGLTTDQPLEVVQRQVRVAGVQWATVEPLPLMPPRAAPAAADTSSTSAQAAADAKQEGLAEPADDQQPSSPLPAAAQARGAAAQGKPRPADGSAKPAETLRVDIERLDQLMNLAGQLVINKARFSQIGDRLKNALVSKHSLQVLNNVFSTLAKMSNKEGPAGQQPDLQAELDNLRSAARRIQNDLEAVRREVAAMSQVRSSINGFFEAVHQLDRVADGIQQNVMDTRMVPIGPLFARFRRMIRDITRANGKLINLVINGEKTALDKRTIDELGDPLIHMVRNAADHGIEPPEVRQAAGKPREGTLTLDAFHRGNSIIIQVSDDGKGLDADRIRSKALERGLIAEADAEKMSRQQIYQLVWEPGLSTAEKVTEVSGRGMGMDIVKSKIEDLHGAADIDSTPGQGTTLTIKLPLTLAILPSLMVQIEGDVFAMPLEAVLEIVSVGRQSLHTVHGKWTARVRGRVISVVQLNELFTWNTARCGRAEQQHEETTLVILGEEGNEMGLVVDRVLGEEAVVIKSIAENYRNVPGIAGASILGDGHVSLILDIVALIDMCSHKNASTVVS